MVFCEELAAQAVAPDFFFVFARGPAAYAEELFWLAVLKVVRPVGRADRAVLPADLPVLLGVLGNIFTAGYHRG